MITDYVIATVLGKLSDTIQPIFLGCIAYGIKKKIQDYIRCAPPAGLYTYASSTNSQEFNDSLLQNMAEE